MTTERVLRVLLTNMASLSRSGRPLLHFGKLPVTTPPASQHEERYAAGVVAAPSYPPRS